jgi:hypothetical protein
MRERKINGLMTTSIDISILTYKQQLVGCAEPHSVKQDTFFSKQHYKRESKREEEKTPMTIDNNKC